MRSLRRGAVKCEIAGREYVAFVNAEGRPVVLGARCAHMGADLSRGSVAGGLLRCPLHGWEYRGDGRCTKIPASSDIPSLACQPAFPAAEIGGHAVFFNGPVAAYPMPFFDGRSPADLLPAEPFEFIVNTPWYLIGANAFDAQHFRIAHDRVLQGAPIVGGPSPFARSISAEYAVAGDTFRDRITRRFSGPRVRMSVVVWSGTVVLVTAAFEKTTSYGMVFISPLDDRRSHVRGIVWVPRRSGAWGRVVDPIDAGVRRRFIRAFMMDDAVRSDGMRYNPATLIEADEEFREYMQWLAVASAASPPATEGGA